MNPRFSETDSFRSNYKIRLFRRFDGLLAVSVQSPHFSLNDNPSPSHNSCQIHWKSIRNSFLTVCLLAFSACTKPPVISNVQIIETSPCVVSVTADVSGKADVSGLRYGKGSKLSTELPSSSSTGSLSFTLKDLSVNTVYSFCVYSVNSAGESVSDIFTLTTSFYGITVTDNPYPSY